MKRFFKRLYLFTNGLKNKYAESKISIKYLNTSQNNGGAVARQDITNCQNERQKFKEGAITSKLKSSGKAS